MAFTGRAALLMGLLLVLVHAANSLAVSESDADGQE
jgi:hypothetical protein